MTKKERIAKLEARVEELERQLRDVLARQLTPQIVQREGYPIDPRWETPTLTPGLPPRFGEIMCADSGPLDMVIRG